MNCHHIQLMVMTEKVLNYHHFQMVEKTTMDIELPPPLGGGKNAAQVLNYHHFQVVVKSVIANKKARIVNYPGFEKLKRN